MFIIPSDHVARQIPLQRLFTCRNVDSVLIELEDGFRSFPREVT
jgi:hypothetical protein